MKLSKTQNWCLSLMMVLEKSLLSDNVGGNVILCSLCLLIVRAALTKYHRLGSLNNRNFCLSSEGLKSNSKCGQGWCFLRAVRRCVPDLCPWLADGHIHLFTSVCNYVPSYKDTTHWFRGQPNYHILTWLLLLIPCFQMRSHSEELPVRTPMYEFWRAQFNP